MTASSHAAQSGDLKPSRQDLDAVPGRALKTDCCQMGSRGPYSLATPVRPVGPGSGLSFPVSFETPNHW